MQLAIPRYSKKGFPPYRYIPTVNPHPEIHPEGHSYNKTKEEVPVLPPEKWMSNEIYLYGVDLFNYGYWWEAHEAWEKVWLTTQKSDLYGQFLQALIQFSAAILKLFSGSKSGFDKLYEEAEKRIQFCLEKLSEQNRRHFMGLHIPEWMSRMETFRKTIQDPKGEKMDPLNYASFPAILLESKPPAHENH